MCSSRSSGVRRPGDLLEARARAAEIGQHELLGRASRRARARPAIDRVARILDERQVPDVRDRRRIAQVLARGEQRAAIRSRARRVPGRSSPRPATAFVVPQAEVVDASTRAGKIDLLVERRARRGAAAAISARSSADKRLASVSDRPASAPRPAAPVCARRTPSASISSRASRRPAVSTSVSASPSTSTRSVSKSRVVPGMSVTIARGRAGQRVEQARFAGIRAGRRSRPCGPRESRGRRGRPRSAPPARPGSRASFARRSLARD